MPPPIKATRYTDRTCKWCPMSFGSAERTCPWTDCKKPHHGIPKSRRIDSHIESNSP